MGASITVGLLSGFGPSIRRLSRWFGGTTRMLEQQGPRPVRWIEGAIAGSEEETLVWEAITHHDLRTYGEVARYVADRLFRRDHAAGGWLSGIGLFFPHYLLHAGRTLERLDGRFIRIEGGGREWD
jgi:hypothetical protein